MRTRLWMPALALLVLAATARADGTWLGGVQAQWPVPASDVGDTRLGGDAGVTLTRMVNPYVGIGADAIYHYWPASAGYEAAFDRWLRTERLQSLAGSDWAMSAFQLTGHIRLAVPMGARFTPWMQVGAGKYRVDLNLDERRPAGTYAWVEGPETGNIRSVGGGYGELGLDFRSSPRVILGVNAAFHYVVSHEKSTWGFAGINDLQDFSAIVVGAHVMFALK